MSTMAIARERPVADPRLCALVNLVGRTPLLEITFVRQGRRRRIHAKAEHVNMTGSIKDRMAVHILACASAEGALAPGAPIVEATSGNTGIAFAAIGRALGHPVEVFMPDWMSAERQSLLRALGAGLHLVSRQEGGFLGSIRQAEDWASRHPRAFLPRQFSNLENVAAHEAGTGPEIWRQMETAGRRPDAFVAGVGTGGTVMGVGRFLRRVHPSVRIHPLEPASSPTLSVGHKVGIHRIQGVSDEFVPSILDLGFLDPVVGVDDGDAILMAQALARELGLAVGISSGANFLGAVKVQDALSPGAEVVTVFPDDDKKYLSTDLFGDEPVLPRYLAPGIRLLGYDALPGL